MSTPKKTTAGKKVAAKKAAVQSAKVAGTAKRKARDSGLQPSTAAQWKAKSSKGYELEVPSGNVALVRPVGMQAFLDKGLIPNSLREIALESIKGKQAPELKIEDLNEEQIRNMMQLFDAVTVYCVLQPEVVAAPLDEEGVPIPSRYREEIDALYVDDVDLQDKMFIFQFACGGTRSVEQFREEYERSMERVSGGKDVEANS
jgi:hypothetical protein